MNDDDARFSHPRRSTISVFYDNPIWLARSSASTQLLSSLIKRTFERAVSARCPFFLGQQRPRPAVRRARSGSGTRSDAPRTAARRLPRAMAARVGDVEAP